jgi:hypothetical protein
MMHFEEHLDAVHTISVVQSGVVNRPSSAPRVRRSDSYQVVERPDKEGLLTTLLHNDFCGTGD